MHPLMTEMYARARMEAMLAEAERERRARAAAGAPTHVRRYALTQWLRRLGSARSGRHRLLAAGEGSGAASTRRHR